MILLLSLRQISEEHSHQIGKKDVIICSIAVATIYIHTCMHANYDLIRILFILLLFLFTCSSNDGTDHGWGGHYMILGGDVKGGQILGEYPSDLTPSGLLVDDRGRFIPTTSWDSIWNGVLQWIGVKTETDLDYCLPNRNNTVNAVLDTGRDFPLFTASSIFNEESSSTSSSSEPAGQSNVDGSRNLRGQRH